MRRRSRHDTRATFTAVWRFTGTLRFTGTGRFRLRGLVANDRSMLYFALDTGCAARRICLTAFGVAARFTVRTGCAALRTERGTSRLVRNPTEVPHPLPASPRRRQAVACPEVLKGYSADGPAMKVPRPTTDTTTPRSRNSRLALRMVR
jgi:hypothetical protein